MKIDRISGGSMEALCLQKKCFPTMQNRWCTQLLKVEPSQRYIQGWNAKGYRVINVTGVRHGESAARAPERLWKSAFIGMPPKFTKAQRKAQEAGKPLWVTPKQKGYYTKDNAITVSQPIVEWSGYEVMQYALEQGYAPNPLYQRGHERVGCYPCIFATNKDIELLEPWARERLKRLEEKVTAAATRKPGKHRSFFFGRGGGFCQVRVCKTPTSAPVRLLREPVGRLRIGKP